MAPSKESEALLHLFTSFVRDYPAESNPIQRAMYDQVHTMATELPGVTYEDITVPSTSFSSTHSIPCKWVRPSNANPSHAILFLHGGGYSFGSANGHRKLAAHLASSCHCAALMPDYRLTPENPYPAALDDCLSAYQYLLSQTLTIITAGDSVGGSLATIIPLAAYMRNLPVPIAAVSISPLYDMTGTLTDSGRAENEERDVLQTREFVNELARRYTEGVVDKRHPLVSPLWASDEQTRELPPHWISVGGYDMLREDGVQMAKKIEKAGVECVLRVQEGQQHVMEFMAGRCRESDESIREIGEWVRRKLGEKK